MTLGPSSGSPFLITSAHDGRCGRMSCSPWSEQKGLVKDRRARLAIRRTSTHPWLRSYNEDCLRTALRSRMTKDVHATLSPCGAVR